MARNEERSNAMLNKWLSQKKELSSQKQGYAACYSAQRDAIHLAMAGRPTRAGPIAHLPPLPLCLVLPCLPHSKRPYLASHCETLVDAEYWRRDIVKSITAKVTEIQNRT